MKREYTRGSGNDPVAATVSRKYQILFKLAAIIVTWLGLYHHRDKLPISRSLKDVIQTFPLWLLIAFGAYALANIGYNLMIFRSCPEATIELQKDVAEAKAALAKMGFPPEYWR